MFGGNVEEAVQGWSNARVRQWWLEELPPALHVYSGIVEECQLDGSDLFQLDMEMLQEFGVKRIHGMKVLKAVDRLRAEVKIDIHRFTLQYRFCFSFSKGE